ncbi:MAG TPA: hypothetical protein PKK60_00010 [archaeon]|nr:hypothetical protein [archaeon]
MKIELNPIFILKNKNFRKITFFDKKRIIFFLILSMISIMIYSSFPIITQIYVRYLFLEPSTNPLIIYTLFFSLLYLFKLIIDTKIEKYKTKYFLKIEKNIKELILVKYKNNLTKFLETKSDILTKDMGLYLLLLKTMYNNLLDLTKIIFISIIIFVFDINLFIYFSISIPFFVIFYFLVKEEKRKKDNLPNHETDFFTVLKKISKLPKEKAFKLGITNIEIDLSKKIKNKTSHIPINQQIKSFVGFYRLFYLTYFGFFIINYDLKISGLIVGLLFLTILIRAMTNLIQTVPFYTICSKSFFKINSLINKED